MVGRGCYKLMQEDQAIRCIVEQLGTKHWSDISQAMQERYKLFGRSGKQCRERYYSFYIDGTIIWLHRSIRNPGLHRKRRSSLRPTKSLETNGQRFRNSSKAGKLLLILEPTMQSKTIFTLVSEEAYVASTGFLVQKTVP